MDVRCELFEDMKADEEMTRDKTSGGSANHNHYSSKFLKFKD